MYICSIYIHVYPLNESLGLYFGLVSVLMCSKGNDMSVFVLLADNVHHGAYHPTGYKSYCHSPTRPLLI